MVDATPPTLPVTALVERQCTLDRRRWRLVLAGDPLQFSAVGRGGMFNHLVDLHGGIELDRVHRFAHRWERDASLRLRRGDTDVLDVYQAHGRIHDGPAPTTQRQLLDAWWAARQRGESFAVVTPTNEVAAELNRAAQQRRLDAGHLPARPRLEVGDRCLYTGDEIVTRRNDRTLVTDRGRFVKNHDRWTIRRITTDGALMVTGPTGQIQLPADYVAEHVQLGYATTSHAAQGRTVDRALLYLHGPTDCRNIYVPLTRGRHSNDIYVALRDEHTARDILEASLAPDRVDEPAHAVRLDSPMQPPPTVTVQRPLEPIDLARLLTECHNAHLAHTKYLETVAERAATLNRLRRRHSAIPQHIARLNAANRSDQTQIEALSRGLGPIRNRGEIRALGDRADDRVRQRAALIAEHTALQPRIDAAERAHATALGDYPHPTAARVDGLDQQLETDMQARLEVLTTDDHLELERRLGPRPADPDLAEAWDKVAGGELQQRAAEQLAGHVPHSVVEIAEQLARERIDIASRQLQKQRIVHHLDNLQRPGPNVVTRGTDRGLSR